MNLIYYLYQYFILRLILNMYSAYTFLNSEKHNFHKKKKKTEKFSVSF